MVYRTCEIQASKTVQKVDLEKTHVGDMPTEAHINQDIGCGSSVALDSSSSMHRIA
jgi:hypothetical protein